MRRDEKKEQNNKKGGRDGRYHVINDSRFQNILIR